MEPVTPETDEALGRLATFLAAAVGVPTAVVYLSAGESSYLSVAGDPERVPDPVLLRRLSDRLAGSGEAPTALEAGPGARHLPDAADPETAAWFAVPLLTPLGEKLGMLCVVDHAPRPWTGEEVRTLGCVAGAVVTELLIGRRDAASSGSGESIRGRNAVPRSVPELRRQIAWSMHACMGAIEDLEAAAEWAESGIAGELVQGLVANLYTLSHSLWPGGKRQSDQVVAPFAEAIRRNLAVEDDSPLHWARLGSLGSVLRMPASAAAASFEPSSLSMVVEGETIGLGPAFQELRELWKRLTSRPGESYPRLRDSRRSDPHQP
jgi:hypothetical protein